MYGRLPYSLIKRIMAKLRQIYWRHQLGHMGEGTHMLSNITIIHPKSVSVGSRCAIGDYCHVWGAGGLTIGHNVIIAAHCVITTQTHDAKAHARGLCYRDTHIHSPITIEDNVWIGSNSTVLPGVTIGRNSIIGAGSVVTKSIPENVVACGVPAKVIRKIM